MKSEWILPDLNLQEIERISEITGADKNIISILYARGMRSKDEIKNSHLYISRNGTCRAGVLAKTRGCDSI